MKNIYVYGFVSHLGEAVIREFKKHHSVIGWLSDCDKSSENIFEYLYGVVKSGAIDKIALKNYEIFYNKYFHKFLLMVQRRGVYWKDFHEIRNEFSILYYNAYNIFTRNSVDIVIFSNLPHEGSDYIFYNVAKELGIKSVVLHQSIFPNKAFVVTSLPDFGRFDSIPELFTNNVEIQEGYDQKLIYMSEIERKIAVQKETFLIRAIAKCKDTFEFLLAIINSIINYRTEKGFFRHIALKAVKVVEDYNFKNNLRKYSQILSDIGDLRGKKVVYVPLHLQPELTTVTLGDLYEDQLSMIEVLSINLGCKAVILVKENPKQTSFQRKKGFFERINSLENVYLVDTASSSKKLIELSDLIATISGTAGWEAVKGGKRCLLFGRPWYGSLPGCTTYSSDLDISGLLEDDFDFDFDKLKKAFHLLMQKCIDGVVDFGYIGQVDQFSYEKNAKTIVDSLNMLILDEKTEW